MFAFQETQCVCYSYFESVLAFNLQDSSKNVEPFKLLSRVEKFPA